MMVVFHSVFFFSPLTQEFHRMHARYGTASVAQCSTVEQPDLQDRSYVL